MFRLTSTSLGTSRSTTGAGGRRAEEEKLQLTLDPCTDAMNRVSTLER
ncbi:MAG: hypothetical protein KME40_29285 [Komarekiella atlantica HA4396-MV6]|nr:hypothetical protein [Komarekiella atlantica HA4396-MV6]